MGPEARAPLEYRGPFQSIATSAPEIRICEHLPLLAQQAHHLALVRSVGATVNTNDHHGGYYYNLTGHEPDPTFLSLGNNRTPFADDWPFMGSVVAAKRRRHAYLPNAITLPHKPSKAALYAARAVRGATGRGARPAVRATATSNAPLKFSAPALELQEGMTVDRLTARRELLAAVDDARRGLDLGSQAANLETPAGARLFAVGLVADGGGV